MEGRFFEEELLKHVIHEVANSLTLILCHAQVLELEVRRKATSQTSERMAKLCSGREQDSVEMIIQQARQIDQVMLMLADATSLSGIPQDEKDILV